MKKYILAIILIFALVVSSQAATITAAGTGNWSAAGTWNGGVVPGDGDTADLNGFDITMDIATIPAAGTLLGITAAGNAGTLVIGSVAGANVINATTMTAGTKGTTGTFQFSSSVCDSLTTNGNLVGSASAAADTRCFVKSATKPWTHNGNITGGAGSSAYGAHLSGAGTVQINGNITGGSGVAAHGLNIAVTATINIDGNLAAGTSTGHGVVLYINNPTVNISKTGGGGTITGSNTALGYGLYTGIGTANIANTVNLVNGTFSLAVSGKVPVISWSAANYWTFDGSNTLAKVVSADDLRSTVVNGTVTGNRTDCPAASAISTQQYGASGTSITGTYHEATTAEVKNGVTFGPASAYTGTYSGGTMVEGTP